MPQIAFKHGESRRASEDIAFGSVVLLCPAVGHDHDHRLNLAVGLQGHYEIDRVPFKEIEDTFIAMRQLGVKVVISELDIDVIPRGKWWAEGGKYREEISRLDPYRDGCPLEVQKRQADRYGQLFRIFRRYPDVIARVSFWDLHDGQSGLNAFPWRRVNYPLLFDRQGQPKPAFAAVISVLKQP